MGTKRPSGRRYPEDEREMRAARSASERRRLALEEKRRAKKKKRRRRIGILVAEVIILSVLCVFAYATVKMDKLDFNFLDEDKLEVYKDTGPYTNIALFGLDAREGESIESGVRSDSMMIASINNETNEVKVVSIFRDTLLKQQDGTFDKANAAYSYGGPQEAIGLLNRNLDLDIKNYMSVDFKALSDVLEQVKDRNYKFIIYMDDLSFEEFEIEYKYLKAVIEGGLETKPDNVLIYATSNRRHLIRETWSDRSDMSQDELHRSDTMQEKLSLVARFGVSIGYYKPSQKEYFNIVTTLAKKYPEITLTDEELRAEANKWELSHGGISGRTAQQFINHLMGLQA